MFADPCYRLLHIPTGNKLRTTFTSMTAAILFAELNCPRTAGDYQAIPSSPEPDSRCITDVVEAADAAR